MTRYFRHNAAYVGLEKLFKAQNLAKNIMLQQKMIVSGIRLSQEVATWAKYKIS